MPKNTIVKVNTIFQIEILINIVLEYIKAARFRILYFMSVLKPNNYTYVIRMTFRQEC